uniref:Uncharacterized protein n=1 Tax=Neogobius melanostomus TaxID=47308 RepID=A0A8C6UXU5_9GOBI
MSIPIPGMLFGLGGKCILNWALVVLQRDHIWRSFVCVFSLSLAIIDTVLTLTVTFIHLQGDSNLLGWRLTRYHVCLLVQILGYIYSAQHSGVVIVTVLEHLYVISRRLRHNISKSTWTFQLFLTLLIWFYSIFYVFKLSNVQPYLEDLAHFQIHHCWTSSSSVISELAVLTGCLCLTLILCHSKYLIQLARNPHSNNSMTLKSQIQPRLIFITKVARMFFHTWALLLLFLFFQVVIPVKMPSHLGLNCAWLCFLNSLLIAAGLCVVNPAPELGQGLAAVPPDSICDWKTEFSLESDLRNRCIVLTGAACSAVQFTAMFCREDPCV